MDFIDELRQFSSRAEKIMDAVTTEEATKTSLILPFFQLLGYDVFNPLEFIPEFVADVGTKKGEKVDYAIVVDGSPAILVEAKCCKSTLDRHDSQLFRYFGTTSAKFGILTNGILYKFYTDLNEPNKMDLDPFLVFNLLELRDNVAAEVKRFAKDALDIEAAFNAASELKFTNRIKNFIQTQRTAPSDEFVKYMMSEIYDGIRTQQSIDRFRPIVKRGLNQYISDAINETLKTALQNHDASENIPQNSPEPASESPEPAGEPSRIVTTEEELEAFGLIKGLLCSVADPAKLGYKDTESYFGILYENKTTKWICRLKLDGKKKTIFFPPSPSLSPDKESRFSFDTVDELRNFQDMLVQSVSRFLAQ